MLRILLSLALYIFLASAGAQDFAAVPPLKSRVTDAIGMLNASQKATLENVLKDYETRSGSQIALLLIGTTAPEAIEQYGIRVAEAWKLGRKGVDDGVILIVAKDNPKALRRLRIEAGRGVQGTVTDAQSKRILQDVIAPYFRQNDFYGGLAAGISALTGLLDQEHLPAPSKQRAPSAQPEDDLFTWLPFLVIALIGAAILASRNRSARNALHDGNWGQAAGVILGSGLGNSMQGGRGGNFGSGGSGDSGVSGGGGSFDGGGASGDW